MANQELLNQLKEVSREANRRIRQLKKNYDHATWAERILYDRVNIKYEGLTPTGRVKANKRMKDSEIKASIKAVNDFLNDKRSTVKGLEETKDTLNKAISKHLEENIEGLTTQEADTLVQLFEDEDAKNVMKYIPPSDFFTLIKEAKDDNKTEIDFMEMMEGYINFSQNSGAKEELSAFYNKFFSSGKK